MICSSCGKELKAGVKFCTTCGAPVEGTVQEAKDQSGSTGESEEYLSPDEGGTAGQTMASTCPACGGQLIFDPASGKLKCEFCDTTYDTAEIEASWKDKEEKTAGGGGHAGLGPEDQMLAYSCSTCGAQLMADRTTAVMRCPYCGNQTIAPAQFSGQIRPDYIIPFAHTKKQAVEKYKSFYQKRFLLPASFKTDSHVQEIQGVYVPFWMFSGRTYVDGRYVAYDETKDDKGNKVKSRYFDEYRKGYLDYKNVPADASKRMEDDLMDSVEPYKLDELKDFSLTYLPGFLAERYDVSEEECLERAHNRTEGSLSEQVKATIKHDGIEEKAEKFEHKKESSNYALLPVWLLVTKWNNKTYKFAMNGQTGKMVGDLPVSAGKLMAVVVPLFFLVMILGMMFIGDIIGSLVAALIAAVIVGVCMYSSMKSVKTAANAEGYITHPLKLTVNEEEKIGAFKVSKTLSEVRALKFNNNKK